MLWSSGIRSQIRLSGNCRKCLNTSWSWSVVEVVVGQVSEQVSLLKVLMDMVANDRVLPPPRVRVLKTETKKREIVITVREYSPLDCSRRGKKTFEFHSDDDPIRLRHLPILEQRVFIEVAPRFPLSDLLRSSDDSLEHAIGTSRVRRTPKPSTSIAAAAVDQ